MKPACWRSRPPVSRRYGSGSLGIFAIELVAGRAREGAVRRVVPERVAASLRLDRRADRGGALFVVCFGAAAADVFHVRHKGELFASNVRLVVDAVMAPGKDEIHP